MFIFFSHTFWQEKLQLSLIFGSGKEKRSNVWFQKMSILSLQKGLEIPRGGGSQRPKNCMKLNWTFQKGGGLRKNPFYGRGMDNE